MKTLHWYLTRQVMASLFMTVSVFTFVLLLGNVLKEIIELLISRQATLWMVFQALGLLIPYVLVFALPMGLLTATLLVFGRFSADQELTAVRASGVSLIAVITPILLLSVACSALSAWINLDLAPRCRVAYKNLLYQTIFQQPSLGPFRENQFVTDIPGGSNLVYAVYVGKIDGRQLKNILIFATDRQNKTDTYVAADRGTFLFNTNATNLVLTLYNTHGTTQLSEGLQSIGTQSQWEIPIDIKALSKNEPELKITDMTLFQLMEKSRELTSKGISDPTPILVQIHSKVAYSFACIGFTMVGIPLGIRAHRKETSVGIAVALGLVLAYYSFIILGQALQTHPNLAPYLIVWIPNFVFQAIGAVLLWRANRGV